MKFLLHVKKRFSIETVLLTIITLVGGLFRISQVQDWLVYSDSYKFILISRAISKLSNVITLYPEVEWSFNSILSPYKWFYPFLVGVTNTFVSYVTNGNQLEVIRNNYAIEHFWVIFPFVISTILLFEIFKQLNINTKITFVSILVFIFSGTSIIWSGFIITEPLGVAILLLLILLNLKKVNFFLQTLVAFVLFLTRPELVVIGFIFAIYDLLLTRFKVKPISLFFLRKSVGFLSVFVFFLLIIFSLIYRENFAGDFVLYISYVLLSIVALFYKKQDIFRSKDLNGIYLKIGSSIIVLSLLYFDFNSQISRYVLILIPLLLINTTVLLETISAKFLQKYIRYFSVIFVLLISVQMYYAVSFPKYETVEYQREVARQVIVRISQSDNLVPKTVYAMQTEGLYLEDYASTLVIKRILEDSCNDFPSGAYVLIDNSYREFCDFDNSGDFELVSEFSTKSVYRRDNNFEVGNVQIWKRK
jgi:hypothetical protein